MTTPWELPDTPFFDDAHGEVVDSLNAWIASEPHALRHDPPGDLDAQCA